jgi:hypothetical protein
MTDAAAMHPIDAAASKHARLNMVLSLARCREFA